MKLYKIGNWFFRNGWPFIPKVCDFLIRIIHNCVIYSETDIGKGTKFGYGGIGVVIHKKARIGEDCVIGTNVTIGGRSKSHSVPVIGDSVYIATGAKVLGAIVIGNNVVIGANAVVINDIPDGCVVVGIPGRIIKTSIKMIDYR